MISNKNYEKLINNLHSIGCLLVTDLNDIKTTKDYIVVTNGDYFQSVKADNYIYRHNTGQPEWFNVKNPYIIDNINHYFEINKNGNFVCISSHSDLVTRDSILKFKCCRCGTIIKKSMFNALRKDGVHNGILCSNCDELLESVHAVVLKQLYVYYYPDTIIEDPSCINHNTNKIMKTDIVNHRLRVAIEIQGQYHDRDEQQIRDKIKKEFWLNMGYKFYDYKIEGVSVLDYVKLFFPDLEEIPKWIKMDYGKKLNLVEIQNMLNKGFKIADIAEKLNIQTHRIYDALYSNKIFYPQNYLKSNKRPVIMLTNNMEYINEYPSYAAAERDNNITKGLIASCVCSKTYYSSGYYWIPKDIYIKTTNN